jgi:hypothetical protein
MKKLILCAGIFLSALLSLPLQAQININIINQPLWGPTGYDYVEYYYLPDVETYYYVPERQYIYLANGQWIRTSARPTRLRGYDLNRAYKVVINEPHPYRYHDTYRSRYSQYRGRSGQAIIRHSKDPRYYVIANHPHHGPGPDPYQGRSYGAYTHKGHQEGRGEGRDYRGGDHGHGKGHGHGHGKGHGRH